MRVNKELAAVALSLGLLALRPTNVSAEHQQTASPSVEIKPVGKEAYLIKALRSGVSMLDDVSHGVSVLESWGCKVEGPYTVVAFDEFGSASYAQVA